MQLRTPNYVANGSHEDIAAPLLHAAPVRIEVDVAHGLVRSQTPKD